MMLVLITLIVDLKTFKNSKGLKIYDDKIYLSGGLKGGFVTYEIPVGKGTTSIKMRLKMKNLSGSTLGVYVKNFGRSNSPLKPPLKIGTDYYLWEGTEDEDWTSSRPEFLQLFQGNNLRFVNSCKIEILLYAGGGFFRRGRFIIEEIEIIEKGLSSEIVEFLENNGIKVEDNYIFIEVFFPYNKSFNEAQRRAMALRGAKLRGEKLLMDAIKMLNKKKDLHFEILDVQYLEDGAKLKIGLNVNHF